MRAILSVIFSNCSFSCIFKHSGHFPLVFGQFNSWLMLHYTKMVEGSLIVLCLIVFIFLSDRGRLVQVLKKKGSTWNIFCHCFLFSREFRQVRVWPILDFREIAKLSLPFACPIIFIFLLNRSRQEELKYLKTIIFKYFWSVFLVSRRLWTDQVVTYINFTRNN